MTDDVDRQNGPSPEEALDTGHSRISPGHLLRSARERKGLTVEEVTAQTLLAEDTVRALEDNDFERLSQPVFVRGYYRKCAKLLGLPEDEMLEAYARWTGEPDTRPHPPSSDRLNVVPQDVTPQPRRRFTLLLVLAALALALLAWLWLPQALQEEPGAGPEPAADIGAAVPPETGEGVDAGDAPDRAAAAPDTPSPATVEPPPQENAVEEPAAPAGASLVLRFDSQSWVRVTDADGTLLIDGIVDGGNQRVLNGRPPYRVALGYAPGVEVWLDGRQVPMADNIRANDTARFTIPADGTGQ